jgi:hypothetical protein
VAFLPARPVADLSPQLAQQTRLADAGIADDEDDLAFAVLRALVRVEQ